MDLFTELTDNDAQKISGGGKNWGDTTSDAIADGFEQGEHSSSFAGQKRQGLGNLNRTLAEAGFGDAQGLDALNNFISSQL